MNIDVFVHVTVYVEIQTSFQKRTPKGPQNRAQMDPKSSKMPSRRHIKKTSKNDAQNEPKLVPKWGPKVEPKSPKMMSWGHLCTRVAPKWPPDSLQARFWTGFGTIYFKFSRACRKTTKNSKPRPTNPRVLQRTERLLEEGPAAVGVALK